MPADLTRHRVNREFALMVTLGLYNEGTNAPTCQAYNLA